MLIFVKMLTGKEITVEVENIYTIGEMKKNISKQEHIPLERLHICGIPDENEPILGGVGTYIVLIK